MSRPPVLVFVLVVVVAVCLALAKPAKPHKKANPHANGEKPQYNVAEAKTLFREFAKEYRIKFKNNAEREHRFKIFLSNLEYINSENKKDHTHSLDIGPHAHLTYAEFTALSTGMIPTNKSPSNSKKRSAEELLANLEAQGSPPASMDWRKFGKVGRVRDQKHCDACWAFVSAAALESHWAIKHGVLASLSPQNLIDCSRTAKHLMKHGTLLMTSKCNGCHGGAPDCAYYYVYTHGGLHTERSYPLKSVNKNPKWFRCRHFTSSIGAKVQSILYTNIPGNEAAIRTFVGLQGPAIVSVCASKAWMHYGAGVMQPSSCDCGTNHGVLLIGYGTYRGQPVWIIKNSWAKKWGKHGGFAYLRRGPNTCGIHSGVLAPVVA